MPVRKRKYAGRKNARRSFDLGYQEGVRSAASRSKTPIGLLARPDLTWDQWNPPYRDGYMYGYQARSIGLSLTSSEAAWRLALKGKMADVAIFGDLVRPAST